MTELIVGEIESDPVSRLVIAHGSQSLPYLLILPKQIGLKILPFAFLFYHRTVPQVKNKLLRYFNYIRLFYKNLSIIF